MKWMGVVVCIVHIEQAQSDTATEPCPDRRDRVRLARGGSGEEALRLLLLIGGLGMHDRA
jgi:hypothetical protein